MGLRHDLPIRATPTIVYDCLQRMDLVRQWMVGVDRIEDTSPPDLTGPVGSRFRMWLTQRGKRSAYDGEVLEADRPHLFVLRFGNARFTSQVTYRLTATPDGTVLAYAADFEQAGFVLRAFSGMLEPIAKRLLVRQLESLRSFAETRAHAHPPRTGGAARSEV